MVYHELGLAIYLISVAFVDFNFVNCENLDETWSYGIQHGDTSKHKTRPNQKRVICTDCKDDSKDYLISGNPFINNHGNEQKANRNYNLRKQKQRKNHRNKNHKTRFHSVPKTSKQNFRYESSRSRASIHPRRDDRYGHRTNRRPKKKTLSLKISNGHQKRHHARDGRRQKVKNYSGMVASDPEEHTFVNDGPKRPAAVERLEQQLHPSLPAAIHKLKKSMASILQKMQRKVEEIKFEQKESTKSSRGDVTAVREELEKITRQNNEAYDVILDVSQLTRYVMLKNHQRKSAPAPVRHIQKPRGLQNRSVYIKNKMMSAESKHRNADKTYREIMYMKTNSIQQDARAISLEERLRFDLSNVERLQSLKVYARKVLIKLHIGMDQLVVKQKIDRYKAFEANIRGNMTESTRLASSAYRDLKFAQRTFVDNLDLQKKYNEERRTRKSIVRQKRRVRKREVIRRLSKRSIETKSIRELTDMVYSKARILQKSYEMMNRTFTPLFEKANQVIKRRGRVIIATDITDISRRLQSFIMKIDRKLDEIRIFLGDENVLIKRCDDLHEGSGDVDDDDSVIDCSTYGFGSGSGDDIVDDDLIYVTSPPGQTVTPLTPTTTIAPTLKTSAPKESTTQTKPEIEGSGDEDFTFAENKTESTGWFDFFGDDPNIKRPNVFRDKLAEKASSLREISDIKYKMAENLTVRVRDIDFRNSKLISAKEELESYVSNVTDVISLSNTTKKLILSTRQQMLMFGESFLEKLEQIQNKTKKYLDIAMIKVATYKNISDSGNKSGNATAKNKLLTDLIATASIVRNNRQKIRDLRQLSKDPCKSVQMSATKLRNNIAKLREKIERAKQITSSMSASVKMDGKEYYMTSSRRKQEMKTPTTHFGICIKPENEDMAVATLQSQTSHTYNIELKESKVRITIADSTGNEIGQLKSAIAISVGKWTDLKMYRYGQTVFLNISSADNQNSTDVEAVAIPELSILQSPPHLVTVGLSRYQNTSNFTGCLSDVTIEDERIGLLSATSRPVKTIYCTDNCQISNQMSMVFEGNGFARFSLEMIYQYYPIKTIEIQFSSRQKNGVFLLLNDRLQSLQVLISSMECGIHVEARTKRGTTVVRSTSTLYCDGKVHTLLLTFGKNQVEVITDIEDETFYPESSTQEITPSIDDGIFVGGLGSQNQLVGGKSKLRSIVGCIPKLSIDGRLFPLYMSKESKNVHIGKCEQNIWFQCVRFDEESLPINLQRGENAKKLYIVISRDSMGRAINYKNKNILDIDILVDGNGIEVFDTKEDTRQLLSMTPSHDDYWFVVSIEDDSENERVTVSLNGSSVQISYKFPSSGWLLAKKFDKSKSYSITLGATNEGSDKFTGGISRLVIDDSYIFLSNYVETNKLHSCSKSRVDVSDTMDMEEKPVC